MDFLQGAAASDLLIVRHGEGRGRRLDLLTQVHAHIAATRPHLVSRIRVHATGSPPPSLAGVGKVLFLLSDPLKEKYPKCFADAVAIAEAAAARGIEMLNPPLNLSNSIKSRQAELWREAGIPCADAMPIRSAADLKRALDTIGLPMIVRSDAGHVQEGARVCTRVAELEAVERGLELPAVALRFIDVRAKWRDASPDSVMARYYHKKRSMVYGDTVLNNHLFFSADPIVGLATCTFEPDASRSRAWLRRIGVGRTRWRDTLAADYSYFHSPAEAPEIMLRAVAALGLHLAAIDYASLPDGSVVLWEANPYPHLPPWHESAAAHARGIRQRTQRQIEVVSDWLDRLATRGEPTR